MKKFINCTPHDVVLNNGTVYKASGIIARCVAKYSQFDEDGIASVSYGEVTNLPEPSDGVLYIVSALVLDAMKGIRTDLVAPATGHHAAIRDKGNPVSVPGFVRL